MFSITHTTQQLPTVPSAPWLRCQHFHIGAKAQNVANQYAIGGAYDANEDPVMA